MPAINTLNLKHALALAKIVESDYPNSKLTDHEFAVHATKVLGFDVTRANVYASRIALSMKSTKELLAEQNAAKRAAAASPKDLMASMQKSLEMLERRLINIEKACGINR